MPPLEAVDPRAIKRAAQGLAPMVRRRSGLLALRGGGEPEVARMIRALLEAVADDDLLGDEEGDWIWCRVERSGLVLVGLGERAYIVARVAQRGGLAARLLVP